MFHTSSNIRVVRWAALDTWSGLSLRFKPGAQRGRRGFVGDYLLFLRVWGKKEKGGGERFRLSWPLPASRTTPSTRKLGLSLMIIHYQIRLYSTRWFICIACQVLRTKPGVPILIWQLSMLFISLIAIFAPWKILGRYLPGPERQPACFCPEPLVAAPFGSKRWQGRRRNLSTTDCSLQTVLCPWYGFRLFLRTS